MLIKKKGNKTEYPAKLTLCRRRNKGKRQGTIKSHSLRLGPCSLVLYMGFVITICLGKKTKLNYLPILQNRAFKAQNPHPTRQSSKPAKSCLLELTWFSPFLVGTQTGTSFSCHSPFRMSRLSLQYSEIFPRSLAKAPRQKAGQACLVHFRGFRGSCLDLSSMACGTHEDST